MSCYGVARRRKLCCAVVRTTWHENHSMSCYGIARRRKLCCAMVRGCCFTSAKVSCHLRSLDSEGCRGPPGETERRSKYPSASGSGCEYR